MIEAQVPFEVASAFVLGTDIGEFAGPTDRAVISEFVIEARANRFSTLTEMARVAPSGWRNDEDGALTRIDALAAGAGIEKSR